MLCILLLLVRTCLLLLLDETYVLARNKETHYSNTFSQLLVEELIGSSLFSNGWEQKAFFYSLPSLLHYHQLRKKNGSLFRCCPVTALWASVGWELGGRWKNGRYRKKIERSIFPIKNATVRHD